MLDRVPLLPRPVFLDRIGLNEEALPFALLAQGLDEGLEGALVTLVGIQGSAPRTLGTQMAVLADGRYCGYISGGCLEAAVAAEAMRIMRQNKAEIIRFGAGSRFLDIRLPCGGGIDLHFAPITDSALVAHANGAFKRRQPFALDLTDNGIGLADTREKANRGTVLFRRTYRPPLRLLLVGAGAELVALSRLACAAGLAVTCLSSDPACLDAASAAGARAEPLANDVPAHHLDQHTATVFLFHDHERELPLLVSALAHPGFYVGALGSQRTQQARRLALKAAGMSEKTIDRLHGPVGLFGPTRDAASLAISILAEITALVFRPPA